MDGLRRCIVALNMLLVVAAISNDTVDSYSIHELSVLQDGGVWIFTCEEYCAFCGCIGHFLEDQNKCICNCEKNAADLKCLDDVKLTKEFLGLNHTLEIHHIEPNHLEHVLGIRVKRQPPPPHNGRRPFAPRRAPRRQLIPNPLRPHPRPIDPRPIEPRRRPFRRREPFALPTPLL